MGREGIRDQAHYPQAYRGADLSTCVNRPTALRDRSIILLLFDTGIRASELCALTIADYDTDRGRLIVRHGKGDKPRYLYPGDRTRKTLWRYLAERTDAKPNEPLFATRTKQHIDRGYLRSMLKRLGDKASVSNVFPHRFRHTFAISFLRAGGRIEELQKILGHESLDMVLHYARLAEIDIERAGRDHSPADKWKL